MAGKKKAAPRPGPWRIEFFQRHEDEDALRSVPAKDFLDSCPPGIRADFLAVVKAVADVPPPQFSGGGKWEAMHGEMKGFYEVRATGPQRRQFRLFVCSNGTPQVLQRHDYGVVRRLGAEYGARTPHSVLR